MNKNPETLKIIQELSDAIGPSGFEDEAVNTARKYVEDIARVEEDCLRNLYMPQHQHRRQACVHAGCPQR